ncbi:hypothetical protein [Rhizosaccharibacter radicis]|uniref:Uncharacterized protein n=1 Tax=Rhizosaccharibacter radicis TaxID=2782605 RepID=A0ABT1VYX9_9PROT|nr:hypothetical protein [Acetobacteraceae bacterium KSS12]
MSQEDRPPGTTRYSEEEFRASLTADRPPAGLRRALAALWYASRGEREAAHGLVQEGNREEDAHVHALLHREEGDSGNAAYWYRRAKQPVATGSVDAERGALLRKLLAAD